MQAGGTIADTVERIVPGHSVKYVAAKQNAQRGNALVADAQGGGVRIMPLCWVVKSVLEQDQSLSELIA